MSKFSLAALPGGFGGSFLLSGLFHRCFLRGLRLGRLVCSDFSSGSPLLGSIHGFAGERFLFSRRFPRRCRFFLCGSRFPLRAGRFAIRRSGFLGSGSRFFLHNGGFFPGCRSLFLRCSFFLPRPLFFRFFLIFCARRLGRPFFFFRRREYGFSTSCHQAKSIAHLRFTPFILSEILQHEFHRRTGNQHVPVTFPVNQVGIYLYPLIQEYDRGDMFYIPVYGRTRDRGRKKFALPAQKHFARATRTNRVVASGFRPGFREKILLAFPTNRPNEIGLMARIPGNRKNIAHKRNDNFTFVRNKNRRVILGGVHLLPCLRSSEKPNLNKRNVNS